MKSYILYAVFCLLLVVSCKSKAFKPIELEHQYWIHGSKDCNDKTDVAIQVVQFDENTWLLRQNKCTNYEAPFMFLFFGKKEAMLFDTGATKDHDLFPLRRTIDSIISEYSKQTNTEYKLTIAHTHSHGDHHAADQQFINRQKTNIVGLKKKEVLSYFNLQENGNSSYDLGGRSLKIMHIPGHHQTSIAIYDKQTKILLTGDTFYPGRLYVNDWSSFKNSIKRLATFTDTNKISYILGNHIEMSSTPKIDYPIETTYQPEEHQLPLYVSDLKLLNTTLDSIGSTVQKKVLDKFIIYPVN